MELRAPPLAEWWGGAGWAGGLKRQLGWPAWVNSNAYHYTSTWRDYEGRRQTESYIRLACSKCFKLRSFNKCCDSCMCVVILYHTFCYFSFSIPVPRSPPPPPPHLEFCSQWEFSEALLKCGHWGWCNQAFKNSERGRNNREVEGGGGARLGWGGGWEGRYLAYFSLLVSRSAGSREWLLRAWIWMLRLVLLLSLSVWLQLPRTRWCHSQGFVNILDKETKSRGWA